MKIYVAAASAEIDRAERVMDMLRSAGHEITCDWTALMRVSGLSNVGLSSEQQGYFAAVDLEGVRQADLLVLLVPQPPARTQGAWWEAGYAAGLGKPVLSSGRPSDREHNIFLAGHPAVDTDAQICARLRFPL